MLKQGLQQRLLQKLSPQQIQLIKLLQIPTDALEERIKEEMEGNPALEEGMEEDENEEELPATTDENEAVKEEEPSVEGDETELPEAEEEIAEIKEDKEELDDLENGKIT